MGMLCAQISRICQSLRCMPNQVVMFKLREVLESLL